MLVSKLFLIFDYFQAFLILVQVSINGRTFVDIFIFVD